MREGHIARSSRLGCGHTMLEIRTFGSLSILLDGAPLAGLASRKATALLLYLAYTRAAHAREVLAELFWEEQGQEQALGNLRVALASLKAQLAPYLEITRQSLAWNPNSPTYFDAVELNCVAGAAARARDQGRPLRDDEQLGLDAVLADYRGDFLRGFYLKDSVAFEGWVSLERERLRRLAAETLCALAEDAFERGEYRAAARRAAQLLSVDSTKEECHRKAMLALALAGDRSGALAQFERCRRVLAEELDVEPEPATLELYRQIRDGLVPARPPAAPHEYISLPAGKPDVNGHAAPSAAPVERPAPRVARPRGSFIGREADVAALAELLAAGPGALSSARGGILLTLWGPAGCGKTRLAVEVTSAVAGHFPDGTTLLDLAAVPEPGLLVPALAAALGVQEQPGASLLDTTLALLESKRQLIVLDGCEHLAGAAGELALAILAAAAGVSVVATSQAALGVAGEIRWHVRPLPAPAPANAGPVTAAEAAQFPAIQLFVQRARAVDGDFVLGDSNVADVVRICRQLDGLPLALELAAAQVRLLSPRQIADRLADMFRLLHTMGPASRLTSLVAAMAWSCSLLSQAERTLLGRLSVFRGEFTLEAAEFVCSGDDLAVREVLPLLGLLVDKSIVASERPGAGAPARYRLLEVLRQYIAEWLDAAGEAAAVRGRHLAFYRDAAEGLEDRLRGPEQGRAVRQIEGDYDNFREALTWGLTCLGSCVEDALRLVAALAEFWTRLDRFDEARTWLGRALSIVRGASPALQARVYCSAGTFAWLEGNYADANAHHTASLERWGEAGDRAGVALALNNLATVACYEDKLGLAASEFADALAIYEELGDTRGIAAVLIGLNFLAGIREDYTASREYGERSLPLWRQLGDEYQLALVLHNLGDVARLQGDFERARVFLEESIALCRKQGNRRLMMMSLTALGRMALGRHDEAAAKLCLRQALALSRALGDRRWLAEQVEGLAELAVAEERWPLGARLFGGAMTLLASIHATIWLPDLPGHLRAVEAAKLALGAGAFEAEWVAGSAMTVDRLLDLATAEG